MTLQSILAGRCKSTTCPWKTDPSAASCPECGKIIRQAGQVETPTDSTSWPLAFQPLKLLASPADRGLGDIIGRTIGPVGGDAFKAWYIKAFGRPCGCDLRQEVWNARFPLPPASPASIAQVT